MYKIKVNKTGLGWKITLFKKYWIFYITDTISYIKIGYEYKVDNLINEWISSFNIPKERVIIE